MTVSEFQNWEDYDEMHPIGLIDLHFGRLMHLFASIYSDKGHVPKIEDFIIGRFPEKEADIDELNKKLDHLAATYGGNNNEG